MPDAETQRDHIAYYGDLVLCTNPIKHFVEPNAACLNADFHRIAGDYLPVTDAAFHCVAKWNAEHPNDPWPVGVSYWCSCKRDADGYVVGTDGCAFHGGPVEPESDPESDPERTNLIYAARDAEQRYLDAGIARDNAYDALRAHDAVVKRAEQRARIDAAFQECAEQNLDADGLRDAVQRARYGR